MAIMLFKEGDSFEYKGIKCDYVRCAIKSKEGHINLGYTDDIYSLYKEKVLESTEEKVEEKGLSNEEIRALAKESDIEGWETSRISTLKKALDK